MHVWCEGHRHSLNPTLGVTGLEKDVFLPFRTKCSEVRSRRVKIDALRCHHLVHSYVVFIIASTLWTKNNLQRKSIA
jgi:hypothetical protein